MKLKSITFCFLFLIIFSSLSFAQQPYTEDYYQKLYKKQTEQQNQPPVQQQQQQPQNNEKTRQYYSLQFDKKGERILEGFVKTIKEDGGEVNFIIETKHWGDIKGKLKRNTNFTPSKATFKEGEYAIIKQSRSFHAISIDIPAIWDAKKREYWFESSIRKK